MKTDKTDIRALALPSVRILQEELHVSHSASSPKDLQPRVLHPETFLDQPSQIFFFSLSCLYCSQRSTTQ